MVIHGYGWLYMCSNHAAAITATIVFVHSIGQISLQCSDYVFMSIVSLSLELSRRFS